MWKFPRTKIKRSTLSTPPYLLITCQLLTNTGNKWPQFILTYVSPHKLENGNLKLSMYSSVQFKSEIVDFH